MSTDQFVSLPPDVLNAGQKFEAVNLLAAIARFALPGSFSGNTVERDLDARFSTLSAIGLPDATAWLSQIGVKLQPLDAQVAALQTNNDAEPLHQALQAGNNAQSLQLLAINDASKLVEIQEDGSSHPLCSRPQPSLLLRIGYNTQSEIAYYAASLPGDSHRAVNLTWQSVVAAGMSAAVAILPPAKPVDMDRVAAGLHIINQAFTAIAQAHADILDAIGQSSQAPVATATPAPVPEQVV